MVAEKGKNSEEINNKVRELNKSMAPQKSYISEEKNKKDVNVAAEEMPSCWKLSLKCIINMT